MARMVIRLLQWNVLFRESASNIVGLLREIDADILCLQELTSISAHNEHIDVPAFIAENLGMHYHYQIAQEWDAPGDRHTLGNGIFSRFPITRRHGHFVRNAKEENPHDPSHEGRVYLEVDITLPDERTLTVGTTHLSYIPRGIMTPEKKMEIDELLAQVSIRKELYVFTGDLNDPPDSYVVGSLGQHLRHCGPPYDVLTWPTRPFRSMDHTENELGWRLDYVFATPDMEVADARIIDTPVSDHLPIMVDFKLS